jgi:hypothetical protein
MNLSRRTFLTGCSIASACAFLPLPSALAQLNSDITTTWPTGSSGDILAATSNANALLYAIQSQHSTPSSEAWTSLYSAVSALFTNMAEGGFNTALQQYTTGLGTSYPSGNYPINSYVNSVYTDMNSQSASSQSTQFQTWANQNQTSLSSETTNLAESEGVVACQNLILFQLHQLTDSKTVPLTRVNANNSVSMTAEVPQPELARGCAYQASLYGALAAASFEVPPVAAVMGLFAVLFDVAASLGVC